MLYADQFFYSDPLQIRSGVSESFFSDKYKEAFKMVEGRVGVKNQCTKLHFLPDISYAENSKVNIFLSFGVIMLQRSDGRENVLAPHIS